MDTNEQQLSLINEMIGRAKRSYSKMNFYFLLWGWLLCAAGLCEYILSNHTTFNMPWIGWPVVGIIGGILAGIHGARQGKSSQIFSYMDRIFMFVWIGFVVTLILFIVSFVYARINPGPFIMMLTALPTFISGGTLKFKPLIIGGVLFWVFGAVAFFGLKEYSSLIFSVSIICGYIIPGYLLKQAEKNGQL